MADPFWSSAGGGATIGGISSVVGGLLGRNKKSPQAQGLSESLRNYGGQMANIGQGAFGELQGMMGDGFQGAYSNFYNQMAQANQPQRDQQVLDLENRLFQQGRLGSTGGAFQQQGDEQAYQQALMGQALQGTQGYMQMLGQMGEGMFSSLAPYKGIADPTSIDPLTGQRTQAWQDEQAAIAAAKPVYQSFEDMQMQASAAQNTYQG